MSNYNKTEINHTLISNISSDGTINHIDAWKEEKVKHYKSNKRGMQMFKKNDYIEIQENVIKSILDLKIWNYLIKNFSKYGFVIDNGSYVTITSLSKKFNISRQHVSAFIRRSKEAGFIKKVGTNLKINPLIIVPYGISDDILHELQTEWKLI